MSDSDAELRRLVNALPQYEEQIRYWESQLDAISNVKADIFQAQDTINGMIKSAKSNEMLVPVGHNTSIFATINDMDRVLVGIGSRHGNYKRRFSKSSKQKVRRFEYGITNLSE